MLINKKTLLFLITFVTVYQAHANTKSVESVCKTLSLASKVAKHLRRFYCQGATRLLIHIKQAHFSFAGGSPSDDIAVVQNNMSVILTELKSNGFSSIWIEGILDPDDPFFKDQPMESVEEQVRKHYDDVVRETGSPLMAGAAIQMVLDGALNPFPADTILNLVASLNAETNSATSQTYDAREDNLLARINDSPLKISMVNYGALHRFAGTKPHDNDFFHLENDEQEQFSAEDNIANWNRSHHEKFGLIEVFPVNLPSK